MRWELDLDNTDGPPPGSIEATPAALQSAEAIHAHFSAHCGLTRIAHHDETDLLLNVWSRDRSSVAQSEGIA